MVGYQWLGFVYIIKSKTQKVLSPFYNNLGTTTIHMGINQSYTVYYGYIQVNS